jgi:hypothetical protein
MSQKALSLLASMIRVGADGLLTYNSRYEIASKALNQPWTTNLCLFHNARVSFVSCGGNCASQDIQGLAMSESSSRTRRDACCRSSSPAWLTSPSVSESDSCCSAAWKRRPMASVDDVTNVLTTSVCKPTGQACCAAPDIASCTTGPLVVV